MEKLFAALWSPYDFFNIQQSKISNEKYFNKLISAQISLKPTISSWFLSVPVYLDRAKVNPCLKNYLFCDHDMPDLNCKIMQKMVMFWPKIKTDLWLKSLFMEKYPACFKLS